MTDNPKRVLFCILNWGLGHATRSIVIIRALQDMGYTVEIASDGGPLALLRKTFPECRTHELRGYAIRYPSRSIFINALSQVYKMIRAVRAEHRQVAQLIKDNNYSAIISDNRYGCHHTSMPCIFITHQLSNITQSPWMNKPGEWIIYNYLKHFDEIWVPDTPDRALTGKMTATVGMNIRFIGHISDMRYEPLEKIHDLTAILSGPEPQRTKLEQEILPQLAAYPGKCALVRGLIVDEPVRHEGNVTIHPYLDRPGINRMLNSSSVIVCRTGYTSLMDLLKVGTKAILIPTPGQPEQLYLGERLQGHEQFVVLRQGEVDVVGGVRELKHKTPARTAGADMRLLTPALENLEWRLL